MAHYIDAEKLIAEIEILRDQNKELLRQAPSIGREFLFGISGAYSDLLKIIDSLQQKQSEINLEKEIEDYCGAYKDRPVPDFIEAVARHFYELGLNTRRG